MTYNGPRYGKDALPERNGQELKSVVDCKCATCTDMGPWLTEKHHVVTFNDDISMGHVPDRWLKS